MKKDAGVKELKDLKGATVCVAQGTTHEVTLGDYGRANGIDWKPLVFDRPDTMQQTFFGGRCDAMTQDASALAGSVATAAPNPADYLVLPTTISKEPLGPFTRNGDEVWSDIITWLHYGLVEAEELGVTAGQCRRDGEVDHARHPAPARRLRRSRLAARARQQMDAGSRSRRPAITAKSSSAMSASRARSSSSAA